MVTKTLINGYNSYIDRIQGLFVYKVGKLRKTLTQTYGIVNMDKQTVADAHTHNWSDKWLPNHLKPYFRLMRLDRPVGVWLLLWPCFWGQILAISEMTRLNIDYSLAHSLYHSLLFFIGAIIMRGAGCAYNDLVDYKYDKQVKRTKNRPLPAGHISTKQAKYFLLGLLIAGFFILIQYNWYTFFVGAASLILVATYPWMKRYTYWPQAFLGLAFNWGALLGFTSITGYLSLPALLLYLAGIFWTIGYDTIYAHQDKDDDIMIGLKSTAILFGSKTKIWLSILYGLTSICFTTAGLLSGLGSSFIILMAIVALHFFWQIAKLKLDDVDLCLALFKSNILLGGIMTGILLLSYFLTY